MRGWTAKSADQLVSGAVKAFGHLDIMCTNAGILRDRVLWNMSDDDFDVVIETHLRGTFTCARAAVRRMREQGSGGRIVVVSSIAGQRGNFGQTNYAAAKAGIAAYARTWAMECAKHNITVNAIVPNAITRMISTIPGMASLVEAAEKGEPLPATVRKQMGMRTPDDVAPLLVFLSSDEAAGVTGQCIGLGGDKLHCGPTRKRSRSRSATAGGLPTPSQRCGRPRSAPRTSRPTESRFWVAPPEAEPTEVARAGVVDPVVREARQEQGRRG